MIYKFFEFKKIKIKNFRFFLFYGKNQGLKKSLIYDISGLYSPEEIDKYYEKEIIDDKENFFNSLLSGSLFNSRKVILINNATDKILNIIESIYERNLDDISLIINADILEKKSKLRSLFEKNKKFICIPCYPDNDQTLSKFAYNFFREKKISISSSNINQIVNKCAGDREILTNELQKIELFSKENKKISDEEIAKLTNLIENHSISELIDFCLLKNKKKTNYLLNENNFNSEECILIIRTFLNKCKRILKLSNEFIINDNIELTISSAKPPIFWKDKEITKQLIKQWKPKNIEKLIYKLSDLELIVKKNINNSVNLVTDFILDQVNSKFNN